MKKMTMKESQVRWIADVEHFKQLCIDDMRHVFDEDRRNGKRMTKNRRRTWLILFDYFAVRAGIDSTLRIVALDRKGNYACTLIDKDDDRDEWDQFARLGRSFDIPAAQLASLRRIGQARQQRDAQKAQGHRGNGGGESASIISLKLQNIDSKG